MSLLTPGKATFKLETAWMSEARGMCFGTGRTVLVAVVAAAVAELS